ncbi:MAG: hypothetical protein M5U08_21575 [Burkholderiales bacterium]|nr:hypothetical protein [Burkholderiales bacterium]
MRATSGTLPRSSRSGFFLHPDRDRADPLFERRYSERVIVGDGTAAALALGYSTALGRVLAALEADLAAMRFR